MLSLQAAAAAMLLLSTAQAEPVAEPVPVEVPAGATITETAPQPAAPVAPPLFLPRDTPVHFMVVSEVTTKTHLPGHRFRLRVDKPVVVGGATLIPVGATAWGEVLSAKKSGNAGKSGTLEAKLLFVEVNGVEVAISGFNAAKGASGAAETVMGVIALGPLGLFAKGNNAKIKAGELMTGFVERDTELPLLAAAGT